MNLGKKIACALEKLLPSSSEALLPNLLLRYGHTMYLTWTFGLSIISAILASLSILSSATPTSLTPIKHTASHEVTPNTLPGQLLNLSVLPKTQFISKRNRLSYISWGNGWTSRTNTYVRTSSQAPHSPNRNTDPITTQSALVPALSAAAKLTIFYSRLFFLSTSFPPTLSASTPAIYNGMRGQMVRFQYGGLELSFFSMNTVIPWSFVATVAARLRQNAVMGFTGLYGTVFAHETAGLVVFVTLTASGVPVPWVGP